MKFNTLFISVVLLANSALAQSKFTFIATYDDKAPGSTSNYKFFRAPTAAGDYVGFTATRQTGFGVFFYGGKVGDIKAISDDNTFPAGINSPLAINATNSHLKVSSSGYFTCLEGFTENGSNRAGIFLGTAGNLKTIFRTSLEENNSDHLAPGTNGGLFTNFERPFINDDGKNWFKIPF